MARSYQTDQAPEAWPSLKIGSNRWVCSIPAGLLNAGVYSVAPRIGVHNAYWIVHREDGLQFEVVLTHGVSPYWAGLTSHTRPGVTAPILLWVAT